MRFSHYTGASQYAPKGWWCGVSAMEYVGYVWMIKVQGAGLWLLTSSLDQLCTVLRHDTCVTLSGMLVWVCFCLVNNCVHGSLSLLLVCS